MRTGGFRPQAFDVGVGARLSPRSFGDTEALNRFRGLRFRFLGFRFRFRVLDFRL